MTEAILNLVRGAVRPVAILALILGFLVAALSPLAGADVEDAKFAAATLGPIATLMFKAWFDERRKN